MAQFTQNSKRLDPYKNFKFRVRIGSDIVAGISKVGALKRTTEVVKHRDGGDFSSSRKSPGRTEYEAITLERGVTHDDAFLKWARRAQEFNVIGSSDQQMGLGNFRRDIIIEVYNEAGQKVIAYQVFRAWVSEFQALPELDANANAVAIESIKVENEGWQLDESVVEPQEPSIATG